MLSIEMNLERSEFEGWVLERADFDQLPRFAGYVFYSNGACYVCYPRRDRTIDRNSLARIVDLLRRAGPDALSRFESQSKRVDTQGVRPASASCDRVKLDRAGSVVIDHV
jgi:hypothetical protein